MDDPAAATGGEGRERARETFGMDSVDLVDEPDPVNDGAAGVPAVRVPLGPGAYLVLRGRTLPSSERRVLTAFAAHVAAAVERARLAEAAAAVEPVKAADRMRTALLAAVSHDLRTPLAGGRAAISSLRSNDVEFSEEDRAELLATADESMARLNRLIENLLDMSRLQAGALTLSLRPTMLEEVLPTALESLPPDAPAAETRGVDTVPAVLADPPLLERVVAPGRLLLGRAVCLLLVAGLLVLLGVASLGMTGAWDETVRRSAPRTVAATQLNLALNDMDAQAVNILLSSGESGTGKGRLHASYAKATGYYKEAQETISRSLRTLSAAAEGDKAAEDTVVTITDDFAHYQELIGRALENDEHPGGKDAARADYRAATGLLSARLLPESHALVAANDQVYNRMYDAIRGDLEVQRVAEAVLGVLLIAALVLLQVRLAGASNGSSTPPWSPPPSAPRSP
jgi:hypothetical protein